MENGPLIESPYAKGYDAAWEPPSRQPKCPYDPGTDDYDSWHDGYADGTDDYLDR